MNGTPRRTAVAVAAFLCFGVAFFPAGGLDDAYITYWAADALARHGEILNYNGEAVEQSSSLAFVVVIGAVQVLTGLEAPLVGKCLSVLLGLGAIVVTARVTHLGTPIGHAAAALVATCAYFIFWSFGGMESTLSALSGTLLVLHIGKVMDEGTNPVRIGTCAALALVYAASRPENSVILVALLGGVTTLATVSKIRAGGSGASPHMATRRVAQLTAVVFSVIALLVGYRLWKFGLAFPEPVYAKSDGPGIDRIVRGLAYLLQSSSDNGRRISEFVMILLVSGAGAVRFVMSHLVHPIRSWLLPVCGLFLAANLAFVVLVGGDGMPGSRLLVPAIPVGALLASALLRQALPAAGSKMLIGVWILVQVVGATAFARSEWNNSRPLWALSAKAYGDSTGRFSWLEIANHDHGRYIPAIEVLENEIRRLASNRQPVSILSGQSGFVMYHLSKAGLAPLRYIDRFGLTTRDFRLCAASANSSRGHWGLDITVERYLAEREEFSRDCGLGPPDIIYDLVWGPFPSDLENGLREAGYAIVYRQSAELSPEREDGQAFVAVR